MLAVNGRPAGGGAGGYSAAENANENAAMSMKAKLAAWRSERKIIAGDSAFKQYLTCENRQKQYDCRP